MRHMLRDYVDRELPGAEVDAVDAHVHQCRACGLALSRAESEDLELRRVFGELEPDRPAPGPGFTATVLSQLQPGPVGVAAAAAGEVDGSGDGAPTEMRPPAGFTARVMAQVWADVEASRARGEVVAKRLGTGIGRAGRRAGRRAGPVVAAWRSPRLWAAAAGLAVTALAIYGVTRPSWQPAEVVAARGVDAVVGREPTGRVIRAGTILTAPIELVVGADGALALRLAGEPGARATVRTGPDARLRVDQEDLLLLAGEFDLEVPGRLGVLVGSAGEVELAAGRYELSTQAVRHQDQRWGLRVQMTVRAGLARVELAGQGSEIGPEQIATWSTFAAVMVDSAPDPELFAASRRRGAVEPMLASTTVVDDRPAFGQLLDARTSMPLAGGTVTLRTALGVQTVTTEDDGRFRFDLEGLEGGFGVLSATPGPAHVELAALRSTPLRLDHGAMRRFSLHPAHALRGRLLDAANRGLPGAWLQVCRIDEVFGLIDPLSPKVRTDANGGFVLSGLGLPAGPHESYVVVAWCEDQRPHVVLARTGPRPVDVLLELRLPAARAVTLVGATPQREFRLLLPIPGLPLAYGGYVVKARSDADGRLTTDATGPVYVLDAEHGTQLLNTVRDGAAFHPEPATDLPPSWHHPALELFAANQLHWLGARSRFDRIAPATTSGGLISVHADWTGQACLGSEVFLRDQAGLQFLGIYDGGRRTLRCAASAEGELIAVSPEGWVGRSVLSGPLGLAQLSLPMLRSAQLEPRPGGEGDGEGVVRLYRADGEQSVPVFRASDEPATVLSGEYEVAIEAEPPRSLRVAPGARLPLPR
jgi:hypothetical protein